MEGMNHVKVITCPFPQAEVRESNVVKLDKMTATLLLVAFKNQHFAVLEFDVQMREVRVFDGLCRKIDQWKEHVIHSLRSYGLVNLSHIPKSNFSEQKTSGATVFQRVEIKFGAEDPWIVKNSVFVRQKDGHNCGPIACCKVMEVLGYVEKGSMDRLGSVTGGFRKAVMTKFSDLLVKHNDALVVETNMRFDADGNVIRPEGFEREVNAEAFCNCQNMSNTAQVYTLGYCGKPVHVQCLADYLCTMPFCMYCSTSLYGLYEQLPHKYFSSKSLDEKTQVLEKAAEKMDNDETICELTTVLEKVAEKIDKTIDESTPVLEEAVEKIDNDEAIRDSTPALEEVAQPLAEEDNFAEDCNCCIAMEM